MLRFFLAYWFTMFAAAAFLYGAVLTIQGCAVLFLSRRMFLRVSAILQLAAFGVFLGVRFLQPSLTTHAEMTAPANHWLVVASPTFWFVALLNQLNGSSPSDLLWLAHRAWISLGIVAAGALTTCCSGYMRNMPEDRGGSWPRDRALRGRRGSASRRFPAKRNRHLLQKRHCSPPSAPSRARPLLVSRVRRRALMDTARNLEPSGTNRARLHHVLLRHDELCSARCIRGINQRPVSHEALTGAAKTPSSSRAGQYDDRNAP